MFTLVLLNSRDGDEIARVVSPVIPSVGGIAALRIVSEDALKEYWIQDVGVLTFRQDMVGPALLSEVEVIVSETMESRAGTLG